MHSPAIVAAPLPDAVPLFPLPNHVLLPGVPTPFRVFEPRYRELVGDLLALPEEHRWLAVPCLAQGWESDYQGNPPIHRVAVAARILHSSELTEGQYFIAVMGEERCLLTEVASDRLYRRATLEPLPDVPERPDEVERALDHLRAAAVVLFARLPDIPWNVRLLVERPAGPEALVYRLGALILPDAPDRQRLIEERSVLARVEILLARIGELLVAGGLSGVDGNAAPKA